MERLLEKEEKGVSLNTCIFLIVLAVVMALFAATQIGANFSNLQVFTFTINGIVIFTMFIKGVSRHNFSIDLIHSLFCLLFFWVAPIVQISTGFSVWGVRIGENDIIKSNIFILLWLIVYNMGSFVANDRCWNVKVMEFSSVSKKSVMILWWFTIVLTLFIVIKNGFRIEEVSFIESGSRSLLLLVEHSIVAFITFSTLITVLWFKNNKYPKIFSLISICCLLLTCFPTSLSRYAAGSIYICLIVNLFPCLRKKYRFMLLMIVGIVFLFPIMDLYRYRGISEVSFSEIINQIFSVKKYFNSGNYDAYQMLIVTTKFVEDYGATFGRQLFGSILFFVPRQIWSTKPVGSGSYMSTIMGLEFDNISCPIIGEAYINFGVIGIILFALLFGYIIRKIDNTYWGLAKEKFSYVSLLYFYLMPYTFFLCRGDMMSTWAYLFANLVVLFVLVKIFQKYSMEN